MKDLGVEGLWQWYIDIYIYIYSVCKLLLWQCIDLEIFFVQDNDIETLVEELCHKLKNLEQHDGKTSFL